MVEKAQSDSDLAGASEHGTWFIRGWFRVG
jgi:hypothetical protein